MDICVWDKCNNNCLMCSNPDKPWPSFNGRPEQGYDYKTLIKRIERFKAKILKSDAIVLTGGEPTLHPRFIDILKFLRQNYPDKEIRILTNGRRFVYPDFAQEILQTDNLNVAVSLYGPTAAIHDAITQTEKSFEQTLKGLENLLLYKRDGQIFEIRTVISRLSYKHLKEILELVKIRFGSIDRFVLIFMEVEGQADKNLKRVGVSYSQIKPHLEEIQPLFNNFKEFRLYHFPLCTLGAEFWPYLWRTLPAKEVAFVARCGQCQYKQYCLGIHKGYLKKIGSKEFKPIQGKFVIQPSNNFYHPIDKVNSAIKNKSAGSCKQNKK